MITSPLPVIVAAPTDSEEGRLGMGGVLLMLAGMVGNLVFGSSILALPAMQADLGVTSSTGAVIVALYSVGFAASLVLGGRLGDRHGRRRILRIALLAVILASLLVALAPGALLICVGRVIQGVASGLLLPQVLSTIQHSTVGMVRARWTGIYAAAIGSGTALGQLSAGVLIAAYPGALGWRLGYAMVAVVAAVALLLSGLIPATRAESAGRTDLVGALLLGAAVTGIVLPLGMGESIEWPIRLCILGGAVLTLLLFVMWERRVESGRALLPPAVFRSRPLVEGLVLTFLFFAGYGAFVYYFAAVLQHGLRMTALQTALVLMPFAAGFILVSVIVPWLLRRRTPARLMLIGAASQVLFLVSVGVLLAATWPQPPMVWVVIALVCLGGAQAVMYGPLIGSVMGAVPQNLVGLASGLFATVQQLGIALGVPVFALIVVPLQPPLALLLCVAAQILLALFFVGVVLGRRRQVQDGFTHA